jgi:alpha-1,3-fucosyltransferase
MTDGAFKNSQCPVKTCVFTRDESLINQSDVVVLYMETLEDFPVNRNHNQRFVFSQLESPITHDLSRILNDHRIRYGYFNWTLTYRWDSDIVHRGEYGYIVKKSTLYSTGIRARVLKDWSMRSNNSFLSKEESKIKLIENGLIRDTIKRKNKLVAWFVSHCSTPIGREEYVQQLKQYVNVDIFGRCNNQDCPSNCNDFLRTDYKFYLAFGN